MKPKMRETSVMLLTIARALSRFILLFFLRSRRAVVANSLQHRSGSLRGAVVSNSLQHRVGCPHAYAVASP
jgi:hypothetical protein